MVPSVLIVDDEKHTRTACGSFDSETRLAGPPGLTKDARMSSEQFQRITIKPGKCGGRPCIRGMRIRVTDVLQLLSAGATHEEILADYPDLEREDILAVLSYAAHQTDHVVLQSA
jgi:uncharacterized protein (DUF433 family)